MSVSKNRGKKKNEMLKLTSEQGAYSKKMEMETCVAHGRKKGKQKMRPKKKKWKHPNYIK